MGLDDISIKWQLLALCVLLVLVPAVVLGYLSYAEVKKTTIAQVEDGLRENVEIMHDDIEATVERALEEENVSAAEAGAYLLPMLDNYAEISIGKTGYLYVLDAHGTYVLSLDRKRDGENIIDTKDSSGRFFIRDMIAQAQAAPHGQSVVMYYLWQNVGETAPRSKVAAFAHIEDLGWTIGSSAYVDDFLDGVNRTRTITLIVCILAVIIGSFIAYLFASRFSRRITTVSGAMDQVAQGNLAMRVDQSHGSDELTKMAVSFNAMAESVKGLIMSILKNTNNVAAGAESLSAAAEEVNASVEQVSSTIQEIAKGAQDLSKNSSSAAEKGKLTETSARSGSQAASNVNTQIVQISKSTKEGAEKVAGLSTKSKRIGDIVETINAISEQTNLLALNAAIEAARAGDAGRGFAVVADEVRKLAEESKKATGMISELIESIQEEISGSVAMMNTNVGQVDQSTKSVIEALAAFEEIPLLVNQVNKSVTEISAVAEENAAGAEEVSASVEQVTSTMQEVALTAQKLAQSANELKTLVAKFKV